MNNSQLTDTIANMDAEVYIKRQDYKTIQDWLTEDTGIQVPLKQIKTVVDTLADQPLYQY